LIDSSAIPDEQLRGAPGERRCRLDELGSRPVKSSRS